MVVQKVYAYKNVSWDNNGHPNLHIFQVHVVTDFVKTNVGMSISIAYHPNSHSCIHTSCTTIPH